MNCVGTKKRSQSKKYSDSEYSSNTLPIIPITGNVHLNGQSAYSDFSLVRNKAARERDGTNGIFDSRIIWQC